MARIALGAAALVVIGWSLGVLAGVNASPLREIAVGFAVTSTSVLVWLALHRRQT